jgi:3-mercaptopyruvate sulfurtransferase SseA
MKKRYILALVLLAIGVGASCQHAALQTMNTSAKASPSATATPEEAKRITLADAKAAYDGGKALFVDTRPEDAYKREHIKSAINIPAGSVEQRYTELPKDKQIVFYCS